MTLSEFGPRCLHRLVRTARQIIFSGGLSLSLLAGAGSVFVVAGCATGEYLYSATIAGGEKLTFPFGKEGPEKAHVGSVRVVRAEGSLDREKKMLGYLFSFSDEGNKPLRSVLIEDVSDEAAFVLLEDPAPALTDRQWTGKSRLFGPDDPALRFFSYEGNSFRVYRFTVTFADGQKTMLYQGSMVPGWAKTGIMKVLREK